MESQPEVWESIHSTWQREGSPQASDFCLEVARLLGDPCDLLEIGCGKGDDAAYFALAGHRVVATDVSQTAIEACRDRYRPAGVNLRFLQHNTSEPFRLGDASFDLVYARLSLHYFLDAVTKLVFLELARLLRAGGVLAFQCKSVDDPLYGQGRQIETDVWDLGHVRHFFSEAYACECLQGRFEVESMAAERGLLYGDESAWIKVIARKA